MLVRSRPILLLPLNHTLLFHCFLFHFNILYIIWMVLHLGFTKNCKFQKPHPLDTRNKLTVHKTTYVLCPEGKGTFGIQKHSPNPMKWFRSLSGLGNCSACTRFTFQALLLNLEFAVCHISQAQQHPIYKLG